MTRAKKVYTIMKALAITFAVLSIVCLAAWLWTENDAYRKWTGISSATDLETRKSSYSRAINLSPGRLDAYLLLINCYKEDGIQIFQLGTVVYAVLALIFTGLAFLTWKAAKQSAEEIPEDPHPKQKAVRKQKKTKKQKEKKPSVRRSKRKKPIDDIPYLPDPPKKKVVVEVIPDEHLQTLKDLVQLPGEEPEGWITSASIPPAPMMQLL